MTGWTWDYVEWNIDLPRLFALNKQWHIYPPLAIQMKRIAAYIGYKPEANKNTKEEDQKFSELLDSMPMEPMPKVMTPQEYLERKHNGK